MQMTQISQAITQLAYHNSKIDLAKEINQTKAILCNGTGILVQMIKCRGNLLTNMSLRSLNKLYKLDSNKLQCNLVHLAIFNLTMCSRRNDSK